MRADYAVSVEETVWITLSDGCRLAARIWFPVGAGPVPAILEYLPYRRRDRHRGDDAVTHPALAAAGYVCVRVDMRGAGDSDGLMQDEYRPEEWADAIEVIAWIATQRWCDGSIGIMGLSWSGFNALQIGALAPPALKAIVTTCASDDRFGDDMHYMGGCLLNDNLQYGSTLFTWLATPPDPGIVGDRWLSMWQERLNAVAPPALRWMQNQTRNAYWQSGSVCENYDGIKAPVLAVGGWADGYTNAVMRLLSGLTVPRKGLIGPWGHAYPHVATPGPAIGFIAYLVRWFDHWLKHRDTGIMDEPMLTCWMQESEEPRATYSRRAGRWTAEATWPPEGQRWVDLFAGEGKLHRATPDLPQVAAVSSLPFVGIRSGEWCPYGSGPDMPLDQREDDALSLCFDGDILTETLTMLGGAEVELTVEVDAPEAILAVRLNDVSADGVSRRITYGLRNLALIDDLSGPRNIAAGTSFTLRLCLKDVGYEIPAGHRLRLAVSTSYWPLAVGLPGRAGVKIHAASIRLPLASEVAPEPAVFGPPVVLPYEEARPIVAPARGRLTISQSLQREEITVDVVRNLGSVALDDVDILLEALGSETYCMPLQRPEGARSTAVRRAAMTREGWDARVETMSELSFEGDCYRFEASIKAFNNGDTIFERHWSERVPRIGTKSYAD